MSLPERLIDRCALRGNSFVRSQCWVYNMYAAVSSCAVGFVDDPSWRLDALAQMRCYRSSDVQLTLACKRCSRSMCQRE